MNPENKPGLSRHPVDSLIRELISTRRGATAVEVQRILHQIATAPFDERVLPVPRHYRGITYQGHVLGTRERSLFTHLAIRVLQDDQWADGTTEQEFVEDLRQAVRDPSSRLVVYRRRDGHVAGVVAPNNLPATHAGPASLPWVYVAYSADRGIIVSGYQVSRLGEISIPGDATWLR